MRAGETMERQEQGRLHRRLGSADLAAVSEVRGAVRELLRYRWKEEPAQVAELLLSELVTNALVHTDEGAVVAVSVAPRKLRVEVRDFVPGMPVSHAPNADDGTHGRGLILVESLADAWGISPKALGKVVWFELEGERP
ncbi:anti-sigma regulatory factor (Ser/Thr protein kinase) [Streptomyces sp. 840.1]|nr:anti-sigma regulatory factor (Ser/Thr protein kinase) [Streptomyces sp. 840.1]